MNEIKKKDKKNQMKNIIDHENMGELRTTWILSIEHIMTKYIAIKCIGIVIIAVARISSVQCTMYNVEVDCKKCKLN